MIQVRKVQPKDIELLYQHAAELCFDKDIMMDKLESIMLIISSGRICGFACGMVYEDVCLLNRVNIIKEYRRDHLGTALVKTILNNAELNGAKTAYLAGICDEFASSLRFEKVVEGDKAEQIDKLFQDNFGDNYQHNFYEASLIDYFKPCCSK